MFNPSREQVRRFFIDTWGKHCGQLPITPMEAVALDWILLHPEYHALLGSGDNAVEHDYTPEQGVSNPFLHLSMHLGIAEQVSIDQPAGIRAAVARLEQRLGDSHEAHHQVMECLGEMLWTAQRANLPPDGAAYIECVRRKSG